MRYNIRSQVFKSERCTFDLKHMEAWSYDWWKFVEVRNDTVYFNNASYSMQTGKQQSIVRRLLTNMGIPFRYVYIKAGLQNISGEIADLKYKIIQLNQLIANPLSRDSVNKRRCDEIRHIKAQIKRLRAYKRMRVETRYIYPQRTHDYIRQLVETQRNRRTRTAQHSKVCTQGNQSEIQNEYVKQAIEYLNLNVIQGGQHE